MVVFSPRARLALGLVVAGLGYLVAGPFHGSVEIAGAVSALTLLLASVGVVPPKPGDLPTLSPAVHFVLTGLVVAGAYVVNVLHINPVVQGVIVAALALAASVGIVPPQARSAWPVG